MTIIRILTICVAPMGAPSTEQAKFVARLWMRLAYCDLGGASRRELIIGAEDGFLYFLPSLTQ